ncbi:MAG: ribonuclease R family protein [Thermodesulfobacteriota bacterium]
MDKGTIVEYIDRQRMICAVVLDSTTSGDRRFQILTENDQTVNLSARRITHAGGRLDTELNRTQLLELLKQTAARRVALTKQINVERLWNQLKDKEDWVSLSAIRTLCFPGQATADHEAALVRAMFEDGLYFKFDHHRFFPHSPQQITAITARKEQEERKKRTVNEGSQWLKKTIEGGATALTAHEREYVDILKDYYVFEQDAADKVLAREMLTRAGGVSRDAVFSLMVRLGAWDVNENTDYIRYGVPITWPPETSALAEAIGRAPTGATRNGGRVNLSGLPVFTIDGSTTMDYDDALNVELEADGGCRVGVHISDVAHYINRGSAIDREAMTRGSSIYTADQKIPMLPPVLSEEACSLKAGVDRPAISIQMRFSPSGELISHEIIPSIIRVDRHISYGDADRTMEQDPRLKKLHDLAILLRRQRIHAGALQITIPELFIQFIDRNRPAVKRLDDVSPSRMMVAEMMIIANRLFADFLSAHNVPAAFRSQVEPKQRLMKKTDGPGTLFQNWVQRKMVARVVLSGTPGHHAGLGLERYTTATSPIRKYLDLMAQRQVRSILGLETPYTREEVQDIIQRLEPVLGNVARIQQARQRYWVLKYLESRIGRKEEAVVLDSFNEDYSVLIPDYLLECRLPKTSGTRLKPKDLIQVTIQHVSARNNVIAIFFG